jgi:hypothetical protein
VQVALQGVIEGISAAFQFTCAHEGDGSAWCWGSGLFGDGTIPTTPQPVPTRVRLPCP